MSSLIDSHLLNCTKPNLQYTVHTQHIHRMEIRVLQQLSIRLKLIRRALLLKPTTGSEMICTPCNRTEWCHVHKKCGLG